MSHFTVAVIHHPEQDIEELLEPYWEENSVEFEDRTEEVVEGYKNAVIEMMKDKNGKLHHKWDVSDNDEMEPVTVPVSEVYATEEEYANKYFGYRKEDDGRYGFWHNPDAKWDWYEVGGRWNGMLKLKPGCHGVQGFDGVFGRRKKYADKETHCSEAYISDIDFSPDEDVYNDSLRFWEIYIDGEPLKDGEEVPNSWYTKEWYKESYTDKYDFAQRRAAFTTYAVLTSDGVWHEPGEMGWFGLSNATSEDEADWDKNYKKFIEEASPDDILTIVDCHI